MGGEVTEGKWLTMKDGEGEETSEIQEGMSDSVRRRTDGLSRKF